MYRLGRVNGKSISGIVASLTPEGENMHTFGVPGAESYTVLHMRVRVFLMDQPLIGLMAYHRL